MMLIRPCRNTKKACKGGPPWPPLTVTPGVLRTKGGGHRGPLLQKLMGAPTEREQPNSLPKAVVEKLKAAIGNKHVLTDPDELFVYEADALTIHKHLPSA